MAYSLWMVLQGQTIVEVVVGVLYGSTRTPLKDTAHYRLLVVPGVITPVAVVPGVELPSTLKSTKLSPILLIALTEADQK